MKKILFVLIVVLTTTFILSGCAGVQHVEKCINGEVYGFWSGLWHGIIAPVTFVVSVFNHNIAMWAVNNNGSWYAFGFLLGILSVSRFIPFSFFSFSFSTHRRN